jgi:hypothetical protein
MFFVIGRWRIWKIDGEVSYPDDTDRGIEHFWNWRESKPKVCHPLTYHTVPTSTAIHFDFPIKFFISLTDTFSSLFGSTLLGANLR